MTATATLAVLISSCAPPRPAAGAPVAEPDTLVRSIVAATTPDAPRQATFAWRMDEAGSTVQGRGVVRYVAPDRMRLDLFGPRGETYLIAALVGDEFRLPPTAGRGFQLPSPILLWAALGVVAPPPTGTLESATSTEGAARLVYRDGDGSIYAFEVDLDGDPRLRRVERRGGSGVLETVEVRHTAELRPASTTYLDRGSYRELVLDTESIRDVDSFAESIWRPDGSSDRP